MSEQYSNWNARRAIDLNDDNHPNSCQCCSGTTFNQAWWKLDLRLTYPVKTIIFIGSYSKFSRNTSEICIDAVNTRQMNTDVSKMNNNWVVRWKIGSIT